MPRLSLGTEEMNANKSLLVIDHYSIIVDQVELHLNNIKTLLEGKLQENPISINTVKISTCFCWITIQ